MKKTLIGGLALLVGLTINGCGKNSVEIDPYVFDGGWIDGEFVISQYDEHKSNYLGHSHQAVKSHHLYVEKKDGSKLIVYNNLDPNWADSENPDWIYSIDSEGNYLDVDRFDHNEWKGALLEYDSYLQKIKKEIAKGKGRYLRFPA